MLRQKVVGSLPRWGLTSGDRFQVANFDGDKDDDLVIFNSNNWDNVYLGMAASNGQLGNFSVSWQRNWIGGWHLDESMNLRFATLRARAAGKTYSSTTTIGLAC